MEGIVSLSLSVSLSVVYDGITIQFRFRLGAQRKEKARETAGLNGSIQLNGGIMGSHHSALGMSIFRALYSHVPPQQAELPISQSQVP